VIADRQLPLSVEALVESVRRECANSKVIVIQAGHFLLHYDEERQRLVPSVETTMISAEHEKVRLEFAGFPFLTWKLACRLFKALPTVSSYMSVLVNDWQYVPSGLERKNFYAEFSRLPTTYLDEIRAIRDGNVMFLTPNGPADFSTSQPYFSERKLRNQYDRRIEKLIKTNALPEGIELNIGKDGTTCRVSDVMGVKREVYHSSKDADCSNEVAEYIEQVCRLVSCDTIINLYPAICKEFVEPGSELPTRLFRTPISRIINLALPSTGIANERDLLDGAEMAIHRF